MENHTARIYMRKLEHIPKIYNKYHKETNLWAVVDAVKSIDQSKGKFLDLIQKGNYALSSIMNQQEDLSPEELVLRIKKAVEATI